MPLITNDQVRKIQTDESRVQCPRQVGHDHETISRVESKLGKAPAAPLGGCAACPLGSWCARARRAGGAPIAQTL